MLGAEIRIEPVATDPDPVDVLSWTLLASPSGMSIDPASGVMTWTPLPGQVGPHAVSVRVSDRGQFTASRSFEVSVIAAISPPLITSIADQVALVDTALQIQVELANPGAGAPLAFSLDQAPAGMQINLASGLIAWTPTSADVGTHAVIVAVINSADQMDRLVNLWSGARLAAFAFVVSFKNNEPSPHFCGEGHGSIHRTNPFAQRRCRA